MLFFYFEEIKLFWEENGMAEQKRVLHIKISGGWGGIESFIYNVYKNIDRTKIQFDFVTDVEGKDVEDALIKYGAVIYRISNFDFLGSASSPICIRMPATR